MLDIHEIIRGLARKRPVFHSEADFRLALASHICTVYGGSVVREWHRFPSSDGGTSDIWFPSKELVIELVQRHQRMDVSFEGVGYNLKRHGAADQGRYDLVKSVQAIERATSRSGTVKRGYAVMLTNDPEYWVEPRDGWTETYDADFRIHDRNTLSGSLRWHPEASEGTTRGQTRPIVLQSSYDMQWHDYSNLGRCEYSRFRYLAVEIRN